MTKRLKKARVTGKPVVKPRIAQRSSAIAFDGDRLDGYAGFLASVKERVRSAQLKAMLSANTELIRLYWDIGRDILQRQKDLGWGAKVIDRLSLDLKRAFPEMKGFSPRNLKYMRAFADAWPDRPIVQQLVAQIPWGHHTVILAKLSREEERLFYVCAAIEHGWSRSMLALHIERQLHRREGKASTNFKRTLPEPQSDLAQQTLKDPYVFDFLEIAAEAHEREIERSLITHIRDFLLELGVGFAFIGNQVRLEVGDDEFYVDLLFYHLRLNCFVVVELKTTAFKPEYAGQLNFYLSAVDSLLRRPTDAPTIGLLLCKSRDKVVAEYALRDMNKPIGVAEWQDKLISSLPKELKSKLPSIEQIENELAVDPQRAFRPS